MMKKKADIPNTMQGLVLQAYDSPLVLQELEVPQPKKGEVLVKIDSAPVNPSDCVFLEGLYATKKTLPVVPGFEGSGVVVATGKDFISKRLLGKRVSCISPLDGDGTWAEYMVTRNNFVVPLGKSIELETAAMFIVNPLSVIAMTKRVKGKYKAIANTAAASALGQLLNRMCIEQKIPLVNIVRRAEQADLLREQGAEIVMCSSESGFEDNLRKTFAENEVGIAFDAVAGDLAKTVLNALPQNGELVVYGALSGQPLEADPWNIIFENKKISGFWLTEWFTHYNILQLLTMFRKIEKFLVNKHQSNIHTRPNLEQAGEAIANYLKNMTSGKVLIKP